MSFTSMQHMQQDRVRACHDRTMSCLIQAAVTQDRELRRTFENLSNSWAELAGILERLLEDQRGIESHFSKVGAAYRQRG